MTEYNNDLYREICYYYANILNIVEEMELQSNDTVPVPKPPTIHPHFP